MSIIVLIISFQFLHDLLLFKVYLLFELDISLIVDFFLNLFFHLYEFFIFHLTHFIRFDFL